MEASVAWFANKLWVLLIGWFWYDKREKDARIKRLEEKLASQETNIQLLENKLDGLKELIEVKFDHLNVNLAEIKDIHIRGSNKRNN